MAIKIQKAISLLNSAYDINHLLNIKIMRCHALKGNRAGQYAMDLTGGFRLIFRLMDNSICILEVMDITDYH